VIGGFFNPYPYFGYPYYGYPYPYYPYYPYGYPPYYGSYPPPPDQGYPEGTPPPAEQPPPSPGAYDGGSVAPQPEGPTGSVRFLDVPNGARLTLDGRYWLEAEHLEGQWLSVPAGTHTVGIDAKGYAPTDLRIDVVAGQQQDVRIGPLA